MARVIEDRNVRITSRQWVLYDWHTLQDGDDTGQFIAGPDRARWRQVWDDFLSLQNELAQMLARQNVADRKRADT